jgi:hypothetical protein
MHGMENLKNDVISHKTFTFNKQRCENMRSSNYILLDKEISPNLENWSKAPNILNIGTTLEIMRTFYRHLDSRKEFVMRR